MSKSMRHKERYANKSEISESNSADGTAARTRPFSIDEIMQRRKSKKQSASLDGQHGCRESLKVSAQMSEDRTKTRHVGSKAVSGRGVEGDFGHAESDRRRHRHDDVVGGNAGHASKESLKASSRMKEDKCKKRESKVTEGEDKESNDAHRKSKASGENVKDSKKERRVHDKRKNEGRLVDDFDNEYENRHAKNVIVKDRDRNFGMNRGKFEHVSRRRNQNEDDERFRDRDAEKKHESRKGRDTDVSERTQKKEMSESHHEDPRSKRKRSRSREQERDKTRRSVSPSPRGHKQRMYDVREHEELSLHSSKDRVGRFDSDIDRKRVSSNGSGNKSRRQDPSASRLGGYSPRKRKSDAAVKTPSPTNRSPEKKSAGWDSPPLRVESLFPSSFRPDLLSSNKTELSNKHEFSGVVPSLSSIPKATIGILSNAPPKISISVDSIQLTQATRPKRRLYVENLPPSASEAAVMQWLNDSLRPSGVSYGQGTSPCISCIVHKEKGQALVEFLTPVDASTALGFDGKSFAGNILKIRRPKDYVEVTTGVSEKPVAAAVPVRDVVDDSPNKIFIGGISKRITSEMLMEIATAFGPLKAYHFEINPDIGEPCAFVEYVDQSLTLKACAGLSGMKLGGQLLTVTRAVPDSSSVENPRDPPSYGVPEHARPLLEKPTHVLKLENVLDPRSLPTLSEQELEDILEDVRLECARFGVVKSVNVVKHANKPANSETAKTVGDVSGEAGGVEAENDHHDNKGRHEEFKDGNNGHEEEQDIATLANNTGEPENVNGAAEANGGHDNPTVEDEPNDAPMADDVEDQNSKNADRVSSGVCRLELTDSKLDDVDFDSDTDVGMENDGGSNPDAVFEPGCVMVEYRRAEASSTAAHCLHGRVFDGRVVNVGYVSLDVYLARFCK